MIFSKLTGLSLGATAILCGCATSGTQVLAPYSLADGSRFQDVVTIGADKSGTAPAVTHVKTFKLGPKGAKLVADASGSSPGLGTVVIGAAVGGAAAGATGGAISLARRPRTNIYVTQPTGGPIQQF